jgi:hypothetical protein
MNRAGFILKIIVVIILFLAVAYGLLDRATYNPNKKMIYGVTFSKKFAQQMGINWQAAYSALLDDLKVKYLRLPTYWDNIEPQKGKFNFTDIDWQVNEAAKRNVKIIMIVGRRQPRWPECHDPGWLNSLTQEDKSQAIINNIKTVVNRYKSNNAIEFWQVENESFLDFFGECPKMTSQQLSEEIGLVRLLDTRKIIITDSGELSTWYPSIKMGDIFGTTVYRTTWNKYIGYWRYFFLPASYYRVKGALWQKPQEQLMVAELQAEPWIAHDPVGTPLAEQFKTMNAKDLVANADYSAKTNFSRSYFWGVEWWYWLKNIKGDNSVWEAARKYFQ